MGERAIFCSLLKSRAPQCHHEMNRNVFQLLVDTGIKILQAVCARVTYRITKITLEFLAI
jgi:hypothetical protein